VEECCPAQRRFLLNDGRACKVRDPRLDFIPGEVEDPATLRAIEGPFGYIVIADTIGLLRTPGCSLASGECAVDKAESGGSFSGGDRAEPGRAHGA
jgi:hypothetical protein